MVIANEALYKFSRDIVIKCKVKKLSKNGMEYMIEYQDPEIGGVSESWVEKWKVRI